MDKYLKMFKPAMTKWLLDHYPIEEANKRWKKTVYLDEKWIREEGDLGGKKNPMANNMLEAYAFFAFYEAVDRSFTAEDLNSLIDAVMGKSIRMLSHFDVNRLLRHKWIVAAINRYLNSYKKKAIRKKQRNTEEMNGAIPGSCG